jgi:hypothetical protein
MSRDADVLARPSSNTLNISRHRRFKQSNFIEAINE